jgi:two-component system, OmpR family, sensor histidine kinase BaeS
MTWGLRTRLTLSYVLVALLCVLMVSVLANGVLESSFRRYVRDSQTRQVQQVVAQIGSQYAGAGAGGTPSASVGTWDDAGMTAIGMSALEQGMIVKVADRDGRTIWDATVHNNGLCVQMITHMAQNMASRYPSWRGSYTENAYPVRSSFANVGVVTIGYYGPFFLNDQELAFINSLNLLLLWVTLAAMALAVLIGSISARRITIPLARVADATRRIARGQRNVLIGEKTRVRELDGIASSVNDLSRSLGDQEALRRRLTADIAHELRTPLATLQSHLEALIDGVWQPDPARLGGLHEEILRVNRLVADMEQLARFEGDARSLNLGATNVASLVAGICRNHEPQFREKGVALRFTPANGDPRSGGPLLSVDSDKLSQAVINLLSNALKYTPPGGTVDVQVCPKPSGTEIRVADTGVGIDPGDLPRIFERFYRADNSRSRATGGAGIGLSIAKAIVEAHGGTISASSQPGRGSEFLVSLPPSPAQRTS